MKCSPFVRPRIAVALGILLGSGLASACGGDARDDDPAAAAVTIFEAKGCVQCHSVTRLGVDGAAVGPDLSDAATAVPARYGRDLATFLEQPSGTMHLVLTQQIQLTQEERDSIVAVLEAIGSQ
jgi:cytochrome c551/c552